MGLWAAGFGLLNLFFQGSLFGLSALERVAFVVLVPVASFALFYGLIFPLAYRFPPAIDEASMLRLTFPGARKVVWPIIALLVAATLYLVLAGR